MDIENQSNFSSSGRGGARPGAGRPKGSLDKGNAIIRDMVSQALDQAGGVEYLARVAETHPGPFLGLVGKVLPIQLTGEGGGAIQFERIVRSIVEPVGNA
jgi:hypothetical protein